MNVKRPVHISLAISLDVNKERHLTNAVFVTFLLVLHKEQLRSRDAKDSRSHRQCLHRYVEQPRPSSLWCWATPLKTPSIGAFSPIHCPAYIPTSIRSSTLLKFTYYTPSLGIS